jgi:hypothetical protein
MDDVLEDAVVGSDAREEVDVYRKLGLLLKGNYGNLLNMVDTIADMAYWL